MKRLMLGSLLVLVLTVAAVAVGEQREVPSQRAVAAPAAVAGTELIVVPTAVGDKSQVLTVVDPRQRVVAVYHIELTTGKIALKSVRNIGGDLQMLSLNNEPPLPQEIRSLLDQR